MTFIADDTQDASVTGPAKSLQSTTVKQRLNQIDRIRAKGIGDHVALPQLVVCGAQSAGKSSVLEGITGIPFPRQDGVCTKFATEIILRHDQRETSITASIIPHSKREEMKAAELRTFHWSLTGYWELPDVIEDAACLMGIRGFGNSDEDAPAFASDVLRIEVVGDIGIHLTVVDLPGLISVDETDGKDVNLVSDLVDSYLRTSRTIILAVVQATNDIVTEPIIQRARHFDQAGERTVGIITKPDLINKGTEGRVALLTNNLDTTKLKLGFFVLKNPSPEQIAEGIISPSDRERQEMEFFQTPAWRDHGINLARVGVKALQTFIQTLLEEHIEKELPNVCGEIRSLLQRTERELGDLGKERSSIGEQRLFLTKLSMSFVEVAQAALNGTYQSATSEFFAYGENGKSHNRLRGRIHELNGALADYMRLKSQKRKTVIHPPKDPISPLSSSSDTDSQRGHLDDLDGPLKVSPSEFDSWVKEIYRHTRGQELPGNYNNIFLTELFHEQSSRWPAISEHHVRRLHSEVCIFVRKALEHVAKEDHVRWEIQKILDRCLQKILDNALTELKKLCDDERAHPITYNHYYTDNIQKARQEATKKAIQKAIGNATADWGKFHVSNTPSDMDRLMSSLQGHIYVDMNQQACEEAKAGLDAYYKVAMKTFVDNVCRQVIERHLVRNLQSIFTPEMVLQFNPENVSSIASEPDSRQDRRKELKVLESGLRESLFELGM
ncbi:hypothetical protein GX50_00237 [[Emmonsia] crescens]|uniref:Dynamin GTPase n=1 Tax=[Emmonsia] crescens TaxID=73230 RepID=A0A2B7ZUB1_9EURO|nr:hypothetical protein GX50_00237 [Emmonsia crescens]